MRAMPVEGCYFGDAGSQISYTMKVGIDGEELPDEGLTLAARPCLAQGGMLLDEVDHQAGDVFTRRAFDPFQSW